MPLSLTREGEFDPTATKTCYVWRQKEYSTEKLVRSLSRSTAKHNGVDRSWVEVVIVRLLLMMEEQGAQQQGKLVPGDQCSPQVVS